MHKIMKFLWFNGKINRLEYALIVGFTWSLAYFIRNVFLLGKIPFWLFLLILYPYFSQGAKRCQDMGLNGISILTSPLNFLWNFSKKGDVDVNKYGNQPS